MPDRTWESEVLRYQYQATLVFAAASILLVIVLATLLYLYSALSMGPVGTYSVALSALAAVILFLASIVSSEQFLLPRCPQCGKKVSPAVSGLGISDLPIIHIVPPSNQAVSEHWPDRCVHCGAALIGEFGKPPLNHRFR